MQHWLRYLQYHPRMSGCLALKHSPNVYMLRLILFTTSFTITSLMQFTYSPLPDRDFFGTSSLTIRQCQTHRCYHFQ